ncbi:MAG: hypothetical protein GYB68_02215 [Chloroflexi bacterium]|nr:hypothetical protein [Chloroflexota bacterium]
MNLDIGKLAPVIAAIVALVLGAIGGGIWASSAVRIENTGIWQLEQSYQGYYVLAVADAYATDPNPGIAADRLSFICLEDDGLNTAFNAAQARAEGFPIQQQNLTDLRAQVDSGAITVAQNTGVPVCSTRPIGALPGILGIAVIFLTLIGAVGYGVLTVIQSSEEEATKPVNAGAAIPSSSARASTIGAPPPSAPPSVPGAAKPAASSPATSSPAPAAAASKPADQSTRPARGGLFGGRRKEVDDDGSPKSSAQAGAALSAAAEKIDYAAEGKTPPVVQFMTTYLFGDDLYDDSFSIETPGGEFLGETGVGIAETVPGGANKFVTAIEAWLFDKNDIRTVTKVLMSDHAFNDEAIRSKLAAKGEAALIKAGERTMLETASLRVQIRVVDLSYKADAAGAPPNSVVERITIELAAWKKD